MRKYLQYLLIVLFPLVGNAQDLSGVVDFHSHADPSIRPRSIDVLALAKLAKERGMRGVVMKNHTEPTGSIAYLIRKAVPGLEVFGGIVLNRAVGGINPAAVEEMIALEGHWGRVVWMPTFEAEYNVRRAGTKAPFVRTSVNGQLVPQVKEVLALVAKHELTLATGHLAPEESLLLIREAREMGVERIIVTHAVTIDMTVPQMTAAADAGALIEFVYGAIFERTRGINIQQYAAAIRAVGVERCVLSSDLGQEGNPLHPEGFVAFFKALREQGLTEAEITRMAKTNPAKLLGLQ